MASIFKKAKDRSSKEKLRTSSGTSVHSHYNPENPLNAPSEVAQATRSHIARNNNELSFKKGDFFHIVARNVVASDGTIEIFDPIHGSRGRAPASCFKFFEKTHNSITSPISAPNSDTESSNRGSSNIRINSTSSSVSSKHEKPTGSLFGVVLYDFKAERSDELSVNAGDIIYICAHHEFEWYIAKFLNKVGEVGLVPVSYVQLIDAVTRIPFKESFRLIIEGENLPTVDEWKAIKNKHKASSKNVGSNSQRNTHNSNHSNLYIFPVNPNIESFSSTNNKFWFLIKVTMSDNSTRMLCRYYEDFFNFHQKLLSTFPHEGGKFDTKDRRERILPFIPGPVVDVTENLCHKRLIDLNDYLIQLLSLPDYISKCPLVQSFFDIMDGDEDSHHPSNRSGLAVEPQRPAPNLKIINSDNTINSNSTPNNNSSNNPQQQQNHHQQRTSETLSQSNFDRRSQYESTNMRSSHVSNRFSDLNKRNSTSSSTSSILSQQLQQVHLNSQKSTNSLINKPDRIKLKFYYNEDIFALSVPSNIKLYDLKLLIAPKLDESNLTKDIQSAIQLFSKDDVNRDNGNFEISTAIVNDDQLSGDKNFIDKGKFLVIVQ